MRDDPVVIALVSRAAAGDDGAWNEIVERYAPLVWSICLRYQLRREEIDDVGQAVWLLLVEKIGSLREPAALPGWLATTTQRECFRVLRAARRREYTELAAEYETRPDRDVTMIDEEILAAELNAAIRAAFDELPRNCQELLSMLVSDPPHPYADISTTLGVKVGSIGPMRARCLDRLRRSPHMAGLTGDSLASPPRPRHRSQAGGR